MHAIGSSICALALTLLLGACCYPTAEIQPGDGCTPCQPKIEKGKISSMSFEDFFMCHQSGGMMLIDARDLWFFRQGRIPGAINLPSGEGLEDRLTTLLPELKDASSKGRPIVVYCNGFGCHDARTISRAIAAKSLDVQLFGGGWKAWKKCGMPIESASNAGADLPTQPAS